MRLSKKDTKKFLKNMLIFTSPALAVFFYQLYKGVDLETAVLVAVIALYGVLADFFKKISEQKK